MSTHAGGEAELLATRRRKLEALREDGIDPFPHAYPDVTPIGEVKAPFEGLEPGGETDRIAQLDAGECRPQRGVVHRAADPRPGQGQLEEGAGDAMGRLRLRREHQRPERAVQAHVGGLC